MTKHTPEELIADLQREVNKLSADISKVHSKVGQLDAVHKEMNRLEKTIDKLQDKIETLRAEIKKEYINVDKFEPVKLIVYGLAGLILAGVVAALLGIVIVPPVLPVP